MVAREVKAWVCVWRACIVFFFALDLFLAPLAFGVGVGARTPAHVMYSRRAARPCGSFACETMQWPADHPQKNTR